MDIESIYRQALSAGNHQSALQAVFEAGRSYVPRETPPNPVAEQPPIRESLKEIVDYLESEAKKSDDKETLWWHPV